MHGALEAKRGPAALSASQAAAVESESFSWLGSVLVERRSADAESLTKFGRQLAPATLVDFFACENQFMCFSFLADHSAKTTAPMPVVAIIAIPESAAVVMLMVSLASSNQSSSGSMIVSTGSHWSPG